MTLRWRDKLKPSGLYYDGFIQGKELNDVLENHRRDTASTFGTRKSSNVSAAAAPKRSGSTNKAHNSDENVNNFYLLIHGVTLFAIIILYHDPVLINTINYYRTVQILPENNHARSIGGTRLLAPLLTLTVFHFLWGKEEFWTVNTEYNITNPGKA